jgi:quinol monooxygenase YgiN
MPRLAHHVFFTLADDSEASVNRLLAACEKYLTDHEGVVDFAVGRRDTTLNRPVNNTEYHVSLHVVFRDRAAHDAYQTAPRHLEFIAQEKDTWKSVAIFDSLLVDAE